MSAYKRGPGQWRVVVFIDHGAKGRRSLGTFPTRKLAEAAERKALEDRDRGIELAPGKVLVHELVDAYIKNREARGRGVKTIEEYRNQFSTYIAPSVAGKFLGAPYIGAFRVTKLRPTHVAAWIDFLLLSGGGRRASNGKTTVKNKPLAPKTVHHAFALLNASLTWAARMELAGRNVCQSVTPPPVKRSEAKALADSEIEKLIAASKGSRYEHYVMVAMTIGARRGEVLALNWPDVDLEARQVTIRGSMSQTKGRVFPKETKGDKVRVVPLSREGIDALWRQKVMQAADRLSVGALYVAQAAQPVFTDELGYRLTPKSATNAFSRLAKKAGLSTTRLHDLRHTAGSFLIAGGVDPVTAASLLGHDPRVLLGIYAHVVAGTERAAVDVLGDRLTAAINSKK